MAERSGSDGRERPDEAARDALLGHAAPSDATDSRAGQTLGKYRVLASIGRGGMGEILLAQHRSRGRTRLAALKVLASDDQELVRMFMDEAALMARIESRHVLEVFEFGREHGEFYLAMEYLEGRPLVRLMIDAYQRLAGLEYPMVAALGAGAALGLADAHEAKGADGAPLQIVHRDVSPQNIFVTYAGVTKVIDFGVARARERLSRTVVGHVKGKAAYMSPEQVDGQLEIDGRSDVFSLGICLWEMAAGRRLFKRDGDYETMLAVSEGPLVSPTKLRRRPDPALDRILLSALERDLSRRTPSARVLAAELLDYAAARGVTAPESAITGLMDELYREESARERELLERLTARSHEVTANEVEALRSLSGISPRPEPAPVAEVTLVGRPDELGALESFGGPSVEDTPTQLLVASPRPRATSGVPRLSAEARAQVVERAVQALNEQYERERVLRRAGHSARSARRPVSRRTRGIAVWLGRLALGMMGLLGLGALLLVARSTPRAPPAASPPRPALGGAPAVLTPAPLEEAPKRSRPVRELVRELEAQGLSFEIGAGVYLVRDARDRPGVPIAWDASYEAVEAHGLSGVLVRSPEVGTVALSFLGRVDGGPARVEALTVNDCPAEAEIGPEGVVLRYGQARVVVSMRGTSLFDARVPLPRFAERAALMPLALGFGAGPEDPELVRCGRGLGSGELRLERLPPGRYELVLSGRGQRETRVLQVPEEEKKPRKRRRAAKGSTSG